MVPMEMKGQLSGLMGNFDDDPDNDFITPGGTTLSTDMSEEDILDNFAEPCVFICRIIGPILNDRLKEKFLKP